MSGADTAAINSQFLYALRRRLLRVEVFPAPVFAAVNGLALAGGLELVMASDLVITGKTRSSALPMPITAWCQVAVIPSGYPAR
jgi:enoyl-CoA hydratase/carnithine racemase